MWTSIPRRFANMFPSTVVHVRSSSSKDGRVSASKFAQVYCTTFACREILQLNTIFCCKMKQDVSKDTIHYVHRMHSNLLCIRCTVLLVSLLISSFIECTTLSNFADSSRIVVSPISPRLPFLLLPMPLLNPLLCHETHAILWQFQRRQKWNKSNALSFAIASHVSCAL